MARFTKQDIEINYHHGNHDEPTVNVKAQNFGWEGGRYASDRLIEDFGCNEDQAEKALEIVFEVHQAQFWDDAHEEAEYYLATPFGVRICHSGNRPCYKAHVYSEGRLGGWLVVDGLPEVESWDAIKVAAWGRFAHWCEEQVKYLSSYEAIKETIEANGYIERDFEKAGLTEIE